MGLTRITVIDLIRLGLNGASVCMFRAVQFSTAPFKYKYKFKYLSFQCKYRAIVPR